MKYGINLDAYNGLSFDKAIMILKKNGFSTTFLRSDQPQVEETILTAKENGIEFETLHAPFRKINDIWDSSLKGEEMLNSITDGIDICAKHGIKTIICHISSGDNPPNINDVGLVRFERLIEYGKKRNVTIAFENQRKLSNIAYMFEKFDGITFCWDTGHEECFSPGIRFMPIFGNKLGAVHIHDNHRQKNGDDHMLPFDGNIDFERVAKTIAEYGLETSVMLEVDNKDQIYTDMSPEDFFEKAASAAKKLIEKIRQYS